MSVKRVAVIGAGASGLAAVKCCLDEGLEPTCFEKTGYVGGLWHFTEEPKQHQASIYRSTTTNNSKVFLCYSDFPHPDDTPNFLPHRLLCEYLENYASHFHLLPHIRLQHEVLSVTPREGGGEVGAGGWEVVVKDMESGAELTDTYDAVMVCVGSFRDPVIPKFAGLEKFKGRVLHTHEYRDPESFKGQTVIVVGFGDCAIDAAVDVSRVSPKVYVSSRTGNWILPRNGPKGLPYDLPMFTRCSSFWGQYSFDKVNRQIEAICEDRFDHGIYNIKPTWRIVQGQPSVNEDLPARVLAGYIELRGDVQQVAAHGVHFTDGTEVDGVDAIILGTGYTSSYPFIDSKVPLMTGDRLNLYKWIFPPGVANFAVIGGARVIGGFFATCELQSRLATRVFTGQTALPDTQTMKAQIAQLHADTDRVFLGNPKHHASVQWIPYNDDLAAMIGCKPSVVSLLLSDPQLAKEVWYGPCVPAHYRLVGPGAWAGARDVIMRTNQSVLAPLNKRRISSEK